MLPPVNHTNKEIPKPVMNTRDLKNEDEYWDKRKRIEEVSVQSLRRSHA